MGVCLPTVFTEFLYVKAIGDFAHTVYVVYRFLFKREVWRIFSHDVKINHMQKSVRTLHLCLKT